LKGGSGVREDETDAAAHDSLELSCALLLLKVSSGRGDDETDDATAQDSLELSQQKIASITPFGLLGME
jgi:hypothetical protein